MIVRNCYELLNQLSQLEIEIEIAQFNAKQVSPNVDFEMILEKVLTDFISKNK
jgi:hypothetical protein